MQERTIEILKNFAGINQGLLIKKGNRLRTISVMKNVFAVAEIPDEFPRDFALYDLNEFLSTWSLLSKPDLEFKEDHILLKSEKTKIKYFYSSPAVVVSPPENDIKMTNPELTFTLSAANLNQILKASAALKLGLLGISYCKLVAYNVNPTGTTVGNQIVIEVETEGQVDASEKSLKIENLKMIAGDYKVEVFEKAVRFENIADPSLFYFVTVEAN